MPRKWFIGTTTHGQPDREGKRHSTVSLTVPITETEYEDLRKAANAVRMTLRGVLFRLVFANHRALAEHFDQMQSLLKSGRRGVDWGEAHIQTQILFANWLSAVRWLIDHTKRRYHDDPERLKGFTRALRHEFDNHFAYRFTYKLRDFSTHCDLPPLSMFIQSREEGQGRRSDKLRVQLQPENLLETWDRWGAPVSRDLSGLSEPIDLLPLVDDAMSSVERVMTAILITDHQDHRESAQRIVDAVKRLPEDQVSDEAIPTLFAAEIEGNSIKTLSPTPLLLSQAQELLNPPPARPEPNS